MAWWTSFGDDSHLEQLEKLAAAHETSTWTCAKGLRVDDKVIFYLKRPAQRFVAQAVALDNPSPPTGANDGTWESTHWTANMGDIRMLPKRPTREEMMALLPEWGWLRAPHQPTRVPDQLVARVLAALTTADAEGLAPPQDIWLPEVPVSSRSATEGLLLCRTHLTRERNSRLTADKKGLVLAAKGRLLCDACAFDFGAVYGPQCDNFCEVHHNKPLAAMPGARETSIDDLVILCSNCHRAIHRIDPMPTVEALREVIRARRTV